MFKNLFKSKEDIIYEEYIKLKELHATALALETDDPVMEEMKNTQLNILQNNYMMISKAFETHCPNLTPDKSQTLFNMKGSKPRVSYPHAEYANTITHLKTNENISVVSLENISFPLIEAESNFTTLNYSKLRRGLEPVIDKLLTNKIIKKVAQYTQKFEDTDAILIKNFILARGPKNLKDIEQRYKLISSIDIHTHTFKKYKNSIRPKTILNIDTDGIPKVEVIAFLEALDTTDYDFLV